MPHLTTQARAALANRERAYIAASRRRDRSDEARLESALRGSEIHKQLTGKALIITREIVMSGGEYLEEDPTFARLLARRKKTGSPTSPTFPHVKWKDSRSPIQNSADSQSGDFPSNGIQPDPDTSKNGSYLSPIMLNLATEYDNSGQGLSTPLFNSQASEINVCEPMTHPFWLASNDNVPISDQNGIGLLISDLTAYLDNESQLDSMHTADLSNEGAPWDHDASNSFLNDDSIRS